MSDFFTAFLFTVIAGLSMVAGSCLVFIGRGTNRTFMSVSLGFSAGVMICLSVMDIFPEACEHFEEAGYTGNSTAVAAISFFGGILFMAVSYTHLDVYKRQDRQSGKYSGCIFRGI